MKNDDNRQIFALILRELLLGEPEFSANGTIATFHLEGDDIPKEYRFEWSDATKRWLYAKAE